MPESKNNEIFPNCEKMNQLARILFQTKCKWIIIFPIFKDKIQVFWHYDIIYKFKCGGSSTTYLDKTKRHFKVRMCKHFGVSGVIRKSLKGKQFCHKEALLTLQSLIWRRFLHLSQQNNDLKVILMKTLNKSILTSFE